MQRPQRWLQVQRRDRHTRLALCHLLFNLHPLPRVQEIEAKLAAAPQPTFFTPLDESSAAALDERFEQLTSGEAVSTEAPISFGRTLRLLACNARGVARCDFEKVCGGSFGAVERAAPPGEGAPEGEKPPRAEKPAGEGPLADFADLVVPPRAASSSSPSADPTPEQLRAVLPINDALARGGLCLGILLHVFVLLHKGLAVFLGLLT